MRINISQYFLRPSFTFVKTAVGNLDKGFLEHLGELAM